MAKATKETEKTQRPGWRAKYRQLRDDLIAAAESRDKVKVVVARDRMDVHVLGTADGID